MRKNYMAEVALDSGREICYHCAFDYMSCGMDCLEGFTLWGQQEHKEND